MNGRFVVCYLVLLVLIALMTGCAPTTYLPIKGNVSRDGMRIYHLPDCVSYSLTAVDRGDGDSYFATEEEARLAGFRKARNCFSRR